jgi:hypothetical protein
MKGVAHSELFPCRLLRHEEGDVVFAGAALPVAHRDKEAVSARLRGGLDSDGGVPRIGDAFGV